ncbi:serine hydrolase [Gemmatimonas sp.]|uniref:serine hydrolase n=1 Tax=Gemmatimonas sp. TaxID=1962908 RepID=UPI00391F9E06
MRAFPFLRLASVAGVLLLACVPSLRAQSPAAPAAPPVAPADSALQSEMLRLLDALPAQSSMHALHVPSGRTVAVRADQPMSTMSVIKIPIMVQAYRDAEAGRLRLDERHTIREEDLRGGSGLLQRFAVGLAPTMRDLIDQMIITSDNTATDMILARVGKDRVNASLQALGFRDTRVIHTIGDFFRLLQAAYDPQRARWSDVQVFRARPPADMSAATMAETRYRFTADAAMWLGSTTAREMNTLLRGIMTASYANREHSDAMLRHLRGQFYNSRLPATLRYASGVTVSHKTGDFPPISGSDVGIIEYDGGPIVISVFTNGNTGDFAVLENTIGQIAAKLVNAWK